MSTQGTKTGGRNLSKILLNAARRELDLQSPNEKSKKEAKESHTANCFSAVAGGGAAGDVGQDGVELTDLTRRTKLTTADEGVVTLNLEEFLADADEGHASAAQSQNSSINTQLNDPLSDVVQSHIIRETVIDSRGNPYEQTFISVDCGFNEQGDFTIDPQSLMDAATAFKFHGEQSMRGNQ